MLQTTLLTIVVVSMILSFRHTLLKHTWPQFLLLVIQLLCLAMLVYRVFNPDLMGTAAWLLVVLLIGAYLFFNTGAKRKCHHP